MKGKQKVFLALAAVLLLLPACKEQKELLKTNLGLDQAQEQEVDTLPPQPAGSQLTDQEAADLVNYLLQQGEEVFSWYIGEGLATTRENPVPAPVQRFQSAAEMKNATEEVFSKRFSKNILFPAGFGQAQPDSPKYEEIQGRLCRTGTGTGEKPGEFAGEFCLRSIKDDQIVVTVDVVKNGENMSERFEIVREEGIWKLDSWFEYGTLEHPGGEQLPVDTVYTDYLTPAAQGGLLSCSWESASALPVGKLVGFYSAAFLVPQLDELHSTVVQVPASDVAAGLNQWFSGLTGERIVEEPGYNEDTGFFTFDIQKTEIGLTVTSASVVDNQILLAYTLTDDDGGLGQGVATVEPDNDVFRFRSCAYRSLDTRTILTVPQSIQIQWIQGDVSTLTLEATGSLDEIAAFYESALVELDTAEGSAQQDEEAWRWEGTYSNRAEGGEDRDLSIHITPDQTEGIYQVVVQF